MIGFQHMELLAKRSGSADMVGVTSYPVILKKQMIVYGNQETMNAKIMSRIMREARRSFCLLLFLHAVSMNDLECWNIN